MNWSVNKGEAREYEKRLSQADCALYEAKEQGKGPGCGIPRGDADGGAVRELRGG